MINTNNDKDKVTIYYLTPNTDVEFSDFEELTADERAEMAASDDDIIVYHSLKRFECDFNNEFISDYGFIFFEL
jgi:hypothetical protein